MSASAPRATENRPIVDRPARYALYFTPAPGSALAAFGEAILGAGHLPGPGALGPSLPPTPRSRASTASTPP